MFKKHLRRLAAASMAALLAFSVTACGDGTSEKKETDGTSEAKETVTSETEGEEKETGAVGGEGKIYKIGLGNAYMGNDWRQIMCSAAPNYSLKLCFANKLILKN